MVQLRAGDTLLMEAMLAAGAEPSQKDLRGETALQVGCQEFSVFFFGEMDKITLVGQAARELGLKGMEELLVRASGSLQ